MNLRDEIVTVLESIEGYRGLEHERQADAILKMLQEKNLLVWIAENTHEQSD